MSHQIEVIVRSSGARVTLTVQGAPSLTLHQARQIVRAQPEFRIVD